MFKKILIPTDGSPVANKAVRAGIKFAKKMGSQIVGYSAYEPVNAHVSFEDGFVDCEIARVLEGWQRKFAKKSVAKIGKAARKEGLAFSIGVGKADDPAQGIIGIARKEKCDAIFMASHGTRGLAGLILGSVAQRVLAHSTIPVLVFR